MVLCDYGSTGAKLSHSKGLLHSIVVDQGLCRGCSTCTALCPARAISQVAGKARIEDERCLDCGECLRACPNGAKRALTDPLSLIDSYEYKIVLPAPALFGQFPGSPSIDRILTALKALGFNEVFEVARATERLVPLTQEYLAKASGPCISSSCPVVVRLIQARFPSLLPRVLGLLSPMEYAARLARAQAEERVSKGDSPKLAKGIGVFFVTPCAAKATAVRRPFGLPESAVSAVLSFKDIYRPLYDAIQCVKVDEKLSRDSFNGVAWSCSMFEGLDEEAYAKVTGIDDLVSLFEELEAGGRRELRYIDALACKGGCLNGPLAVEESEVANARIKALNIP